MGVDEHRQPDCLFQGANQLEALAGTHNPRHVLDGYAVTAHLLQLPPQLNVA
ncbi:hypothetical protein SDC9_200788 [bioreactor metagenome]|uniref:Uncharacterized protein n=1 Tax=bioreactor metagenome TaxID=1076179 RepID=A0A645IXM1_9ZZZZ